MANQNAIAATEAAGTFAADLIAARERNAELLQLIEDARKFLVIYVLPACAQFELMATDIEARELLSKIYNKGQA